MIVNIDKKTLIEIKKLISEDYCLSNYPSKSAVLIYKNALTNEVKELKVEKCEIEISDKYIKESKEAYKSYANDKKNNVLYCEVGKLVAVSGAALKGREEQLKLLKIAFTKNYQNI